MNPDTCYRRFFHFLLLLSLVLVCYSNSLQSPWNFDDVPNIVANSSIRINDLSWSEIRKATQYSVSGGMGSLTRPVAALTFALNYLYSKYDTTSYHIVNISLHLITSWIVFLVFLQTLYLYKLNIAKTDSAFRYMPTEGVALLGSVLWAIHPIHTQAVTYIVQRQTVLAAMFYMLAMYCYMHARMHRKIWPRTILILLVGVCYFLGIGSKQNAVLLPLSLIGYEVAFFQYSFLDSLRKSRLLQSAAFGAFALLVLALLMKGKGLFDYLLTAYGHRPFTVWERLYTEPIILIKYISLLLTPLSDSLRLESDIIASRSLLDPLHTLAAVIAVTCLLLLGVYLLKKKPIIGFALFFFFANHLVESTFIGLELYFEHRNYLPSMFIYFAISFYFLKLLCYYKETGKVFLRFLFIALGVSILISEGHATYLRNDIWSSDISVMEDSIEKSPENIRPYITVASYYMRLHMFEKAKKSLKNAEDLYKANPNKYMEYWASLLYHNAGALYAQVDWEGKDFDKATALFFKSIDYYQFDHLPHIALAGLFFTKGDYEQAETAMLNALAIVEVSHDDLPVGFYRNFGRILYSNGKLDEAIRAFQIGLEKNPSYIDDLRLNMIAVYLKKDNLMRAKIIHDQISDTNYSPAYLLNKALLYPGEKGELALEKLARLMVQSSVSYCNFVGKIKENKALGLIYPDIKSVEQQLNNKYIDAVDHIRKNAGNTITEAEKCDFFSASSPGEQVLSTSTSITTN